MAKKEMIASLPTQEEISAYAYQLYLQEGCVPGRELDHWLRAEAHLMQERQRKAITAQPVLQAKAPMGKSRKKAKAA